VRQPGAATGRQRHSQCRCGTARGMAAWVVRMRVGAKCSLRTRPLACGQVRSDQVKAVTQGVTRVTLLLQVKSLLRVARGGPSRQPIAIAVKVDEPALGCDARQTTGCILRISLAHHKVRLLKRRDRAA
jgi:hypothetical protein